MSSGDFHAFYFVYNLLTRYPTETRDLENKQANYWLAPTQSQGEFVLDLETEGRFQKKKKKKYGIFHNRAGGSTPFHTFLFIYFLTVKWQFSVNFEFLFSVLPSNQTFNTITFYSTFEQPNNFEYHYTPLSLIPNFVNCVKKQRKFVPWMLKKNHK